MFQGPLSLGLRISAFLWLVCLSMASGILFVLATDYGIAPIYWQIFLGTAVCMGGTLLVASLIFKTAPPRVIWRMCFIGTIILPPIIILTASAGLAFLATISSESRMVFLSLLISFALIWSWASLQGYKGRVQERKFIEREFSVEPTQIVVRQPLKTDLDRIPSSDDSMLDMLVSRFTPYLVFGIPMAYPLQRLVSDTAGGSAIFYLLAALCCPLLIYITGKITCGAYLWLYRVWMIQRQHGKSVVFAEEV